MANGLMPLVGLCALYVLAVGCGSDDASSSNADAGASAAGTAAAATHAGDSPGGASSVGNAGRAGAAASGGTTATGGVTASGGAVAAAGNAGKPSAGAGNGAPPAAVDGHSIYALECHGDSKDCNLAAVPCFGVGSETPNVAAGWACANRCGSNADCSDAPSGAEAKASCVSFASTGHCVLVCKNENQTFACPDGMGCYVPPKSPIGYCLWQ